MNKKCWVCQKEHNNTHSYCSNECYQEHKRKNEELTDCDINHMYVYRIAKTSNMLYKESTKKSLIRVKEQLRYAVENTNIPMSDVVKLTREEKQSIDEYNKKIAYLQRDKNRLLKELFFKGEKENRGLDKR